ncbi:MAG: hypothetical protein LRY27_00065 [Chitinophagales bacterium]|nr:hypothetical protein [Chitinophagales bacterium]
MKENISLQKYNTFGLNVSCRYFEELKEINQLEHIQTLPLFKKKPTYIRWWQQCVVYSKF